MKNKTTHTSFTRPAVAVALFAGGFNALAQPDYPPAYWRPVYPGHWNTSGYGHKFHVIHDIEGYYWSSISYFQRSTTQASVHFWVNGKKDNGSDAPPGEVSQSVRTAYYAWHARCWNLHSTGTEHEGFASNPAWYTPEMYQNSANLTAWICNRFGYAKDRNRVVGHDQKRIGGWASWASANLGVNGNCNTHHDPGAYWDWNGYMQKVNGGGSCVQGAILTRYNQLGGSGGVLGANTTCELTCPDGVGKFTHFQNGSIYWTPSTGAWDVRGAIRNRWSALGWERSALGYPTTGENALAGGAYNHFQGGSIYWSPSTGAQNIQGAIRQKWADLGWENGRLGYPTTSDAPTPGNTGYYNHFQGGSIYWSAGTGAHSVWGAIHTKWAAMGWEAGRLGFPTTDETAVNGGAFNHFQGGSVYWSASTDAHAVHGAIRDKWSALGWENSYLGFPTTDETALASGGAFNHFQRGSIYWHPSTGAHNVQGAIHTKWASMGYEASSLGYPTSDETVIGNNLWRSDFQNGWIIYDGTTGQYSLNGGPTAPSGLSANASAGTQVVLNWTDNSADENGFQIERSTDNVNFSALASVGAGVTTYTNTGVTSGQIYYYKVRSYKNSSADTTLGSAFSNTASVTPVVPPVLAAIGNKTVASGTALTFTASSSNPNQTISTTAWQNFDSFAHNTANETVMFKRPSNSGTTSAFLDASTNYTTVSSTFPAGQGSGKVMKVGWGFKTGQSNPWVRLTTLNTANVPNPTIEGAQTLRFNVHSSQALKVGLGFRETGTAAAYGASGGTTGAIEWAAVTNVVSGAPIASKQIAANTWTQIDINVPFEAQAAFTGDGSIVLAKGTLEHLVLGAVNNASGAYTVYLDNFAIVANNTLNYTLDAGAPAGASINPKNGKFTWTPAAGTSGTFDITVRVTDQIGQTDFEVVSISVSGTGNASPVLAAIGNRTVNEGSALAFTATASDPNAGQTLTYSLDGGNPSGSSIGSSSGAFSWTPTEAQGPGSYPITIRVTDNGAPASNDFETITVTVNEVNATPTLAAIANQTVNEGSTLNLTASGSDSDVPANTLTYSLGGNAPAGMTIGSSSGAISWTPTEANGPSTNTISVIVSDAGGLKATNNFTVTVNEVNVAPVLTVNTTQTTIETVNDFEGQDAGTYNGTVLFRQPAFSASTSAFIDPSVTNYTSIVSTFPAGPLGQRAFFATWSFKTGTTNPWVRLTTFNTASLPNPTIRLDQRVRFSIWTDKSMKIGLGVRETGTSAAVGDNGGSTGTIEWAGASNVSGTPNPSRTLTASNWTTVEFNLPSETITAFPGSGNGVLATGKGVLEHLALVPNGGMGIYNCYIDNIQVVTITSNLVVNTGSTITVQASATDSDSPAQGISYSLDAGAPTNAVIDSSTGLFSWTPTPAQSPSTNVVTIRATDNGPGNLSDTEAITIIVNKINTTPKLSGLPEQAVELTSGGTITLTAIGEDPENDTLTFSLQGSVPSGASIDSVTGVFTWTPPGVLSSNVITFRVTDNGTPNLYDEKDLVIIVTPANAAPTLSLGTARAIEPVFNFETFTNNTPNEAVLFKKPANSSTTSAFVDTAVTNFTRVTTSFPAGNSVAGAKTLRAEWSFKTGTTNYWIRLTTASTAFLPNPTINASARLKFDIHSSKTLKVALGVRETGTSAENGANGGTTGTIEFVGAGSKQANGCPIPTRTVNANTWTTLEFDLPSEPKTNFTGDGILNAGQQVLEHLALVGAGGTGVYTVYVDNVEVVTTTALPGTVAMKVNSTLQFTASATDPDPGSGVTFGLDADAPTNATINVTSGAFSWTPTAAGSSSITVSGEDNPTNGAIPKSDSKTLTVNVSADTLAVQATGSFVAGGESAQLTWDSVAGQTYEIQFRNGPDGAWTDYQTVTATGAVSSVQVSAGTDSVFRVVEVGGSDQ